MTILSPGYYLIELEFARRVDVATLSNALERMGFTQLTPDDTAMPVIGALSRTMLSASLVKPIATTQPAPTRAAAQVVQAPPVAPPPPVSRSVTQTVQVPPIVQPQPAAPAPPPPVSRQVTQTVQASPVVQPQPAAPTPPPPVSRQVTQTVQASSVAPTSSVSRQVAQSVQAPPVAPLPPVSRQASQVIQPQPPPTKGKRLVARKGDTSSTPRQTPEQSSTPDAAASDGGAAASTYGSYDGGGGGSDSDTEQGDAAPPSNVSQVSVAEMWRRWREWGSPFAEGPSSNVAGEEEGTYRFRFIAQLVNPLRIENKPAMRWLYVRYLTLNPFSDLDFNVRPFSLRRGATYEMRFLSRAKAMPTRQAVKDGLAAMGFAPMKLSVMKRNMRIPGRAGASVTLWYAIASWEKGNTFVTISDPFLFLNANEVTS